MIYQNIKKGTFLSRPNRFIAQVQVDGKEIKAHVKNTGRCRELLIPSTDILLEYHPDADALGRKTAYSLIGVYKTLPSGEKLLINMDSQAPNRVAYEWLSGSPEITDLRREVTFGQSRFDLAFRIKGKPAFMEVKGVTLEHNGCARFPDAPTERGVKHLRELIHAVSEGYEAYALFVIQMKKVLEFRANTDTHPEFAQALKEAADAGVQILAYDCLVTEDTLTVGDAVKVIL